MVQHILVALDGSGPSRQAAHFAFSLAQQLKGQVTLLTVLPPLELIPLGPFASSVMAPTMSDDEVQKIQGRLDGFAAEFPSVPCTKIVEMGPVADTIVELAQRRGVDLIVLGARGLGPGRRLLLGSVSDRVVQHAHCPVTVWR